MIHSKVEARALKLNDDGLVLAAQDSAIQRFEYSYDSFWKFFKLYFEKNYNLENMNSPRAVFRMCVEKRLCSEDEGLLLIKMLDDRNITIHNYDAMRVREIYPNIML